MLHFYKFSAAIEAPTPAREVYVKRRAGRGWPEECPPLRAAQGFGWDVTVSFDMVFHRGKDGSWRLEQEVEVESDWVFSAGDAHSEPGSAEEKPVEEGDPLTQKNACVSHRV